MGNGSTGAWGRLERWCGSVFLAVAGVWLASAVLTGDHTLTRAMLGMELGDTPFALVLLGIVGTFVCLLGMYPRLADDSPWLATGGVTLSGFSAIAQLILVAVVAISLSYPAIWDLGGSAAFGQSVGFLWAVGTLSYPAGTTLFGIGMLRTDDRYRTLGLLLFGPLLAWALIGVTLIAEAPWIERLGTVVVPLLLAVNFLAIGLLVRE